MVVFEHNKLLINLDFNDSYQLNLTSLTDEDLDIKIWYGPIGEPGCRILSPVSTIHTVDNRWVFYNLGCVAQNRFTIRAQTELVRTAASDSARLMGTGRSDEIDGVFLVHKPDG